MTKRFYYTDPLKAAIAMRDYGVILQFKYINEFEDIAHIKQLFTGLDLINEGRRVYIHEDSMGIFEPENSDLDNNGRYFWKEHGEWFCMNDNYFRSPNDDSISIEEWKDLESYIIQRDGNYFPWYDGVEEC